jgi:hypothetical protein
MKFELILAVDSGDGEITNVPLAQMTRPDVSELATLGLSLSESKQLLAQLQREIVTRQFEATTHQRRHCGQCGTKRAIKDFHGARFRALQFREQIFERALGHLLELAALHRDMPFHGVLLHLVALVHADVTRVSKHRLIMAVQQGVRLRHIRTSQETTSAKKMMPISNHTDDYAQVSNLALPKSIGSRSQ